MEKEERIQKSNELRADILTMVHNAASGHPGGSLSIVEILMALYYEVANVDPKNPNMENRDRIVLSKGHAAPALYAILAQKGYFPHDDLKGFRQIDSHLQGHPDMTKTPGVDANTGSLGQGVSIAVGMAMAAKYKKEDHKVYAVLGDGEIQEGLVWEAAMASAHYKLDNLTVILDNNNCQIDGYVQDVMSIGDPIAKFTAFGFECFDVDGHDIDAITKALKAPVSGKPKMIRCKTVKGKGISFMENQPGWHGKAPNDEQYESAMKELGVEINGK